MSTESKQESNRPIKFRVWDGKRMIGPLTLQQIAATEAIADDDNPAYLIGVQEALPLQFTGLLDADGKEMYEGDVVEWNQALGPLGAERVVRRKDEVKCNAGTFYVGIMGGPDGLWRPLYDLIDYCEPRVIGNIHENPDLLTPAS